MPNNKKKKDQRCIICGNQVNNPRGANTANKHGDSEVLERIREFNRGDIDETKISPFIVCNTCRDEVDIAYECVRKCRGLMAVQLSVDHQPMKDAVTQTESAQQTIIIVNQMSKKVKQKKLEEIFSEYGKIVNFYLRVDTYLYENFDNFAQITFSNEDETLKVMNAAQNKKLWYHDKPLVVTRVSENSSPIDILPDACLAEIFLHVDEVDDKVEIGKVCKRWKNILARSWSNITKFSDTSELEELETVGGLRSVLKGCGRFLKSLKFRICNRPNSRLKLIRKYCKNIENLQLEMNCEARTRKYQNEVLSVFQQCTKLQRLYMDDLDDEFNYTHLEQLPDEMLEIHLFSGNINTKPFIELSKFRNLETLALATFDFGEDSLKGIEHLVNLKYLSFDESRIHPSNIQKIQHFKKLEQLAIANCGLDDGTLSQIAQKNLKLEYLDISDNREITDRSFQYVAHLPKLQTLYMKNLSEVTAADLTEMRTLKYLDVEGCSLITDWTLILMIDKSPSLFSLYASGPATWRLLINAEESMISLGRAPRKLHISTDARVAERWQNSGRDGKIIYVSGHSRDTRVDTDDWDGWQGNVKSLI